MSRYGWMLERAKEGVDSHGSQYVTAFNTRGEVMGKIDLSNPVWLVPGTGPNGNRMYAIREGSYEKIPGKPIQLFFDRTGLNLLQNVLDDVRAVESEHRSVVLAELGGGVSPVGEVLFDLGRLCLLVAMLKKLPESEGHAPLAELKLPHLQLSGVYRLKHFLIGQPFPNSVRIYDKSSQPVGTLTLSPNLEGRSQYSIQTNNGNLSSCFVPFRFASLLEQIRDVLNVFRYVSPLSAANGEGTHGGEKGSSEVLTPHDAVMLCCEISGKSYPTEVIATCPDDDDNVIQVILHKSEPLVAMQPREAIPDFPEIKTVRRLLEFRQFVPQKGYSHMGQVIAMWRYEKFDRSGEESAAALFRTEVLLRALSLMPAPNYFIPSEVLVRFEKFLNIASHIAIEVEWTLHTSQLLPNIYPEIYVSSAQVVFRRIT